MRLRNFLLITTVSGGLLTGLNAQAAPPASPPLTQAQIEQFEKIVENMMAAKPELVENALRKAMEKREKAQNDAQKETITKLSDNLFNDPRDLAAGKMDGKFTLVVFADPYCGYCKKIEGELKQLMAERKDFKVIYKPVAMLSQESEIAARTLLAANLQGKSSAYQEALAKSAASNHSERMELAKDCGLKIPQLEKDMASPAVKKQLKDIMFITQKMQLNGVPALIVTKDGKTGSMVNGFVEKENISKMLDAA